MGAMAAPDEEGDAHMRQTWKETNWGQGWGGSAAPVWKASGGDPPTNGVVGWLDLLAVVPAKHPARVKDDVQSNSTFLFAMTESNSQMRWGVGPRQHRDTAMRTTYWQGWWI